MQKAALFLLTVVSAAFLHLQAQTAAPAKPPIPVVLSTDTGNEVDDQWVIFYLLADPAFDVRGILSAHAPSMPDPAAHWSLGVIRDEVEHHIGLAVHPPLVEGSNIALQYTTTPLPSPAAGFLIDQSRGFTPDHRLTVLTIGAATDTASALLMDPSLADRIRVVAMGFNNLKPAGAEEFNARNDPKAWQVILKSRVPVVIGTGDVCRRDLGLTYDQARKLLAGHGPIADWLWDDFRSWYFTRIKPARVNNFTLTHPIWDIITAAYVKDLATAETAPRPSLTDEMKFAPGVQDATVQTITHVDTAALWQEFLADMDHFTATHAVPPYQPR